MLIYLFKKERERKTERKVQVTHILSWYPGAERLVHVLIYLLAHLGRQIAIRIGFVHVEGEFRPHAQMDDTVVDPVRPVVIDDFEVIYFKTTRQQFSSEKQ